MEFGVVLVDNTGIILISATEAVVKLVQPVAEFVTSTVYDFGAPVGPPTLIAVTEVLLWTMGASVNIFPATTATPVYHCCAKGPAL